MRGSVDTSVFKCFAQRSQVQSMAAASNCILQGTSKFGRRGGSRGGARPGAAGLDLGRQRPALPSCTRHYRAENAESPGFSGSSRGFVNKSGKSYAAWAGPVLTGAQGLPAKGTLPPQVSALLHLPLQWDRSLLKPPISPLPQPEAGYKAIRSEWKTQETFYTPFLRACCQDSLVCSPDFLYEISLTPSDLLCSVQSLKTPNILHPQRTQDPILYKQPDNRNQTKKKSQRSRN